MLTSTALTTRRSPTGCGRIERRSVSKQSPSAPGQATVSLADEEAVKKILVETVFGLWAAVNNLTRLRPSKRERYRITIFGSARTAPERVQSVGIRVELPFEQSVNPFVGEAFEHQTFFTRLHHFVLMSDAFIVAPGGIGTVLESTMIWQLLQVRHLHDTPLIFTGKMWQGLVDWATQMMLRPGFELANAEDMKIPLCVDGADQAIEVIRKHHERWRAAQIKP